MPGTLLYLWIASLGESAASGDDTSMAKYVMLGVGFVATLAVTILIGRKAKAKLEEKGLSEEARLGPKTKCKNFLKHTPFPQSCGYASTYQNLG